MEEIEVHEDYFTDISIDIETLSRPDVAGFDKLVPIIAIGVVAFNRADSEPFVSHQWFVRPPATSNSYHYNIDTIMWWMRQCDEVRLPIAAAKHTYSTIDACDLLSNFINKYTSPDNRRIWTNHYFDIEVLEKHYRSMAFDIPWTFRDIRDVASIKEFLTKEERDDIDSLCISHDAESDAKWNANIVQCVYDNYARYLDIQEQLQEGSHHLGAL